MICPECKEQGLKSRVYPGHSTSTLVYYQPFYDEDGNYHSHDRNTTTLYYSCSNGHHWCEKTKHPYIYVLPRSAELIVEAFDACIRQLEKDIEGLDNEILVRKRGE